MPDAAPHEWHRDGYTVSTDRDRLDLEVVHGYLTRSYWSPGISEEAVRRAVEHSLPFGLYAGKRQVGFARVVTDYVKFAYLADVFVLEEFRGAGLGKLLVESVLTHPELQGIWRWSLVTRDAHELYRRFGFREPERPERYMERVGTRRAGLPEEADAPAQG
ncbi:MAG: GNAT family N-acetyltransferase [Gemmatimonadetes bacterium]|nr:GNAT family N-acetyltransferase [Gemmatimonadota bacterium]